MDFRKKFRKGEYGASLRFTGERLYRDNFPKDNAEVPLVLVKAVGMTAEQKSDDVVDVAPLSQIKVLSYKDKGGWTLESKYNIGKKKT